MKKSVFNALIILPVVTVLGISLAQAQNGYTPFFFGSIEQFLNQKKEKSSPTVTTPPFITYSKGQKIYNIDEKGLETFEYYCGTCHDRGESEDPKALILGDTEKWRPIIAKGMDTLYRHAVNGYSTKSGFAHPVATGQFSDEEIKQAVNYMVAYSSDDNQNIVYYRNGKAQNVAVVDVSNGKELYENTCKTCHESGIAGAPKIGDKKAWAKRIKQGKATLYRHAIEGYQGKAGEMPLKGGNPNLDDELVKKAVDYMIQQSK